MAGGENFRLQLNEFENNIKSFWKDLEADKDFCDVTLACRDQQIKTHKVVISSCSPIFRNILKLNQNPHPLIYLRKIKYKDLQNLLTFMYQGKVNVDEEDLPSFLEMAEDLLIRGLSEGNQEGSNSKLEVPKINHQITAPSAKRKRIVDKDINFIEPQCEFQETFNNLIEHENDITSRDQCLAESQSKVDEGNKDNNQSLVLVTGGKNVVCKKCEKQFSGSSGLYQHNASIHEGVCFSCEQCEHKATLKYSLKQHVESVHQKISLSCDKCEKTFSNRSSLWKHNLSVHQGVRYPCNQCDYKATDTGNLKRHKLKQHNKK